MKDHFIVGDVHGCLHTLEALLKRWKPKEQTLVFVGDLIDHGNYSPQVAELVHDTKEEFPDTVIIRGNHEQMFQLHVNEEANEDWYDKSGKQTFKQYKDYKRSIEDDAAWFAYLPLYYETESFIVSHAGISHTEEPFNPKNMDGVLYHRNEIKPMEQLQIFGHTPQNNACYDSKAHAICIDTGAYKCNKLTAIVVDKKGVIKDILEECTHPQDMPDCDKD